MKRVLAMAFAGYLAVSSAFAQTVDINSDLTANMDAVVRTDSSGWMFNRYDRGSMRNVQVLESSSDGATAVVYGEYSYNGGSRGWVKARLVNGQLSCLEFWDFAGRCRALGRSPSQGIVTGLVVGVAAVAVAGAMTGGSSGSGGSYASGGQSGGQTPYPDDRQQSYSPPPPPPPPPPRTYGLYGDCPAPGAGYGC